MKKRPAYLQDIVTRTNVMLKASKVNKPYNNDLFMMVDKLLLDHDCYKGYGIFITEPRMIGGKMMDVDVFVDPVKYGVDPHNVDDVEGAFVQLY